MGARRIVIEFLGKDKSAGSTAEGVERKTSKLGSTLAGVGKVAAAAFAVIGVAAVKGGLDAIGAASDLNETLSKSKVIFGANAREMRKWAQGAATSMGLSTQAALESAASFGDMFSQLGIGRDKAAGMSKSVVQLAADLGSFNNLPTAEVVDMMSGAFRGEYDSIQRVIPNISAARVQTEALNMTHKKSVEDLTAAEKATATLAIIQRDGARASGDFARTSGGLANQQKILAAQFENVKAKIGTKLLPVAAKLMQWITGQMIPASQRLSNFLRDHLGPVFVSVATFIRTRVIPAAQEFYQWFMQKIAPGIVNTLRPILAGAREAFRQVADRVRENRPQLEQLGRALRSVAEFIASRVMPVLGALVGAGLKVVGKQIGYTIDAISRMVDWVSSLVRWIESLIDRLGSIRVPSALRDAAGLVGSLAGKIPGFAAGGVTPGGAAVVGERGPELALFPRGTRIVPNHDVRRMVGGGGGVGELTLNLRLDGQIIERLLIRYQRDTGRPLQVTTR